jgi:hypothetical protein
VRSSLSFGATCGSPTYMLGRLKRSQPLRPLSVCSRSFGSLKFPHMSMWPFFTTRVLTTRSIVSSAFLRSAGELALIGVMTSSPITQSKRRPWMPLESSPRAAHVGSLDAPGRWMMMASSRQTFSSSSGLRIGRPWASVKSAAILSLFKMCQLTTFRLPIAMRSS